jgi:putative thiamine transport system permease protein
VGGLARRGLAQALRQGLMLSLKHMWGAGPLVLLFVLPLALSLALLLPGLFDRQSFVALFQHPQFSGAAFLTLKTGIVSTVLAGLFAILIVMRAGPRLLSQSGIFLALPHLALALGLGFLFAPTGLLARLLVGGLSPPDWQLVQDPSGFGLITALVLKEAPFLVWAMASVLQSDELRLRFQQEALVARCLGHGPRSAFLKVVLPQLLQRIVWPLVAVFSYGMTVVDMAIVIGPAQPPTLAQLVWTDLNDGETTANARGAAGTLFLSALIVALLLATWALMKVLRPMFRSLMVWPARAARVTTAYSTALWSGWLIIYGLVIVALILQSVSLHWPYPQLLATEFTFKAWANIARDVSPVITSLVLGIATSCVAMFAVVAWFETQPAERDRFALVASTLMLCVPAVLVSLGQYRLLLQLGLTGTWAGLFSAHLLPVMAYVFVMLLGPYRSYDGRWQTVGHGLGVARFKFLTQVKWPMLKGPLFSALAIGFAVSVAQFVSAQLAAAGRFSTLPMEAVTLSSGGNRALISAYALVLMVLPLVGFAFATYASKSRWSDA